MGTRQGTRQESIIKQVVVLFHHEPRILCSSIGQAKPPNGMIQPVDGSRTGERSQVSDDLEA